MKVVFTPEDDNIAKAYKALDRLLKRYRVDLCADHDTNFWFEHSEEEKKTKLKSV